MANNEPKQPAQLSFLFKPKEGGGNAVPLEQTLPDITDVQAGTHEHVEEVLPRVGKPITSMAQLRDDMYVTFHHPDTGKLVDGRIFERINDSQPVYRKPVREDPPEFYITVDGEPGSKPLNETNLNELQIYETGQPSLQFSPKEK